MATRTFLIPQPAQLRGPWHLEQLRLRTRRPERGQSLVEFALVLPMLLVLLLGIADFGRVFAAGILLEATTRNAAEAAAQEYLQLAHTGTLTAADYAHLHAVALATVCDESAALPNRVMSGTTCSMPAAAVCVHDGNDPDCLGEADPALSGDCPRLTAGGTNTNEGPVQNGKAALAYVEVRTCYRFTTLFNLTNLHLPFGSGMSLGTIYLERDRQFTVASY